MVTMLKLVRTKYYITINMFPNNIIICEIMKFDAFLKKYLDFKGLVRMDFVTEMKLSMIVEEGVAHVTD